MNEPKTEAGRLLKALYSPVVEPTPAEISDNELLDTAVDVFARELIKEVVENYLGRSDMRQHELMTDINWRRCRDRVHYILGEMAPEEQEYKDAWRRLTDA